MSIVLSLSGPDVAFLRRQAQRWANAADLVEFRLDGLLKQESVADLFGASSLVTLATCSPLREGGNFAGDEQAWADRIVAAAEAGATWVDVPHDCARPSLPEGVRCVHSFHEPTAKPADLITLLETLNAKARPGDVLKIVTLADPQGDAARLTQLWRTPSEFPLVAFAQGELGVWNRLAALAHGAPWVYSCAPGHATAPGQLWVLDLESLPLQGLAQSATPLWAVLGHPISHSRSPLLWNAAFRQTERSAVFVAVDIVNLPEFLQTCVDSPWQGFAVTAPHKSAAFAAAQEAEIPAQAIAAANTLLRSAAGWKAQATDGPAVFDLLAKAGMPSVGRILVLGAGGFARAVVGEAKQRGHAVSVCARRGDAAQKLAQELAIDTVPLDSCLLPASGATAAPWDAIVQATPLGSVEQPGDPLQAQALPSGVPILDAIYEPAITPLLQRAMMEGAIPIPGGELLLGQMLRQWDWAIGDPLDSNALRAELQEDLSCGPPVFLIGPRAVGKSTLGRLLAEHLQRPFLDADAVLEARHQRRIADWLRDDADAFRAAEAALLPEFGAFCGNVIALGGGVVENSASVAWLAQQTHVLWLDAPAEILLARLQEAEQEGGLERPRLAGDSRQEEVLLLLKRRRQAWKTASSGRRFEVSAAPGEALARLLAELGFVPEQA